MNRIAAPHKRLVQVHHNLARPCRRGSHHDPFRSHAVLHGPPFAQELRIGDHIELCVRGSLAQHPPHLLACPGRHRALVHDNLVAAFGMLVQNPSDLLRRPQNVPKIGRAVIVRRRGKAQENDAGVQHSFLQIEREVDALLADIPFQKQIQSRLVDRHFPPAKLFDLFRIDVHADHTVPRLGKTGAGNQSHVSGSDNGNRIRHDRLNSLAVLLLIE